MICGSAPFTKTPIRKSPRKNMITRMAADTILDAANACRTECFKFAWSFLPKYCAATMEIPHMAYKNR